MEPKISIITPAYNAENFLLETADSIFNQTYKDWEWIIVNDGSTDATHEVCKTLLQKDSRVKYISQKNGRQGKARNAGLKIAKGFWIAFLDADDLWDEQKLAVQMDVAERENVDLVYTSGFVFEGNKSHTISTIEFEDSTKNGSELLEQQLWGFAFPILSVLVKKELIARVAGFDENALVQNAEDYQLWLKLCNLNITVRAMSQKLFYYRMHVNQSTHADSLALPQVLFALSRIELKAVSNAQKNKIMEIRLNRYLLHEFENLSIEKRKQTMALYAKPLNKYFKFLGCALLHALSPSLLQKFGYRYFELEQQVKQ